MIRALTPRQTEVAQLAALDYSYAEMATLLGITAGTVDAHVREIHRRWGVTTAHGVLAVALREGIVSQRELIALRAPGGEMGRIGLGAPLSPRQREIARGIALGAQQGEMALRLGISLQTVKNTLMTVYIKLGIPYREFLIAALLRDGYITVEELLAALPRETPDEPRPAPMKADPSTEMHLPAPTPIARHRRKVGN